MSKYIDQISKKEKFEIMKKVFGDEVVDSILTVQACEKFNVYDDYLHLDIVKKLEENEIQNLFLFKHYTKFKATNGFMLKQIEFSNYNVKVELSSFYGQEDVSEVKRLTTIEMLNEKLRIELIKVGVKKFGKEYENNCLRYYKNRENEQEILEYNKSQILKVEKQLHDLKKENKEIRDNLNNLEFGE